MRAHRLCLPLVLPLLFTGCVEEDTEKSDTDDGTETSSELDEDGDQDTESGTDDADDDTSGDDGGDGGDGGGDGGDDVALSEDNLFSEAGCALMESEPVSLVMGASESEANTAVLVPDDETAWMLQMPATGDGWFTVEVPDWMTVVHFFADEGVEIEIMGGEPFSDVLRNGACPDAGISDLRWAFHEWGSYTVRVAEGAPEEVWFTLVKEG